MCTVFKEGNIIKNLLLPIAHKEGIKISYKRLKSIYIKYALGKIDQDEFNKIVPKEIEKKFLDSIPLDKSALETVNWLKKKRYLLGILSNMPKPWGNYLIKKFKLDDYFSIIVFSGEYGIRKPHEKLYLVFVEKTRVKPQNCYLIDDKLINLKEARFLLMKTIWRKREKQEILFIPDYVITDLKQLKKIL